MNDSRTVASSTLIEFWFPGVPCTRGDVDHIERDLGRSLPESFKTLLKMTGCGILNPRNNWLEGSFAPDGMEFEQLFGHGTTTNGGQNDLIGYSTFLAEEWDVPDEVLLIGCGSSGMHEQYVINYELDSFPVGAILYYDNESTDGMILVAANFDEFLELLGPNPYFDKFPEVQWERNVGEKLARTAPLGAPLEKLVKQSSYADMELLVRQAAVNIANGNSLQMYCQEESLQFQDLIFYLAEDLDNFDSLNSWRENKSQEGDSISRSLFGSSFENSKGYSALNYFENAQITWWESRQSMGVLHDDGSGYKINKRYMDGLIENWREQIAEEENNPPEN